jgi:hypothetical protein
MKYPTRCAFVVTSLTLLATIALVDAAPTTAPSEPTGLAAIRAEAQAAARLVRSDLARAYLRAADELPSPTPRKIYRDAASITRSPSTTPCRPISGRPSHWST